MDTETIQIHLNSKNAMYFNNSISNCEWVLPLIEVPQQHQILISVQHAVIPNSFYNIDQYNDKFNYTINGYPYTVILLHGNYNPYTLISLIQSKVPAFSVTYSVVTNKFTFTHPTYDFAFLSSSTCLTLLGFQTGVTSSSTSKILISTNCVNLQSHHCICLSTNMPTGSINNSNKYENSTLCNIPTDGNPFSMISYTNYNNMKSNLFKSSTSTIQIKLIDQNGNLIDLNGCHWSVTIQLDVIRFVE